MPQPSEQPPVRPAGDTPPSAVAPPFQDLSANKRLPILKELTRTLFDETRDHVIVEEFTRAMREAYKKRCVVMVRTRNLPPGQFRITRWLTPEGRDVLPSVLVEQQVPQAIIRSGGLIARACVGEEPAFVRDFQVENDPGVGDLLRPYRCLISVSLPEKTQPSDRLMLLETEPDALSESDLETLVIRANLIGLVIRNLNIARALKEATAYIQGEIDQIAEIQRSLLPQELPRIPGLDLAANYATFDRAGGDYYDVFPDPKGRKRWGFLIADASGHGPSAAVVVAMLHTVLRNLSDLPEPEGMLEELNARLFARRIGNSFVTALAAVYDEQTRSVQIAGAGHPPPLIRPANDPRTVSEIAMDGGPPLGILDSINSQRSSVRLSGGDKLVFYTDGISEAMSPERTLFGIDRIRQAIAGAPADASSVLRSIDAALKNHVASARPSDDQTVLVVRRTD
jgi:sigma-B regulation protein RsbU (phosphoserine phosphatase)